MEKKFDITKILRVVAMFSLVFMLFSCGGNDEVTTAVNDTDGKPVSEEDMEANAKDCWQAAVVGTIYETTGKLTMSMYTRLTEGAMALMMVAFALWLCFRMMKHVSSFTEESPAEVWTEVSRKFFICFACGLLASSTEGVLFVLNSIIFPLYNAFLELGSAMIQNVSVQGGGSFNYNAKVMNIPFSGEVSAQYDIVCKAGVLSKATLDGFPGEPAKMMECLTCAINERLNFGIKLGWIVMLQKGVMAFFCGLILVAVFLFVKLGFAFYLVDAIFRFAMMVMIMPILIMAYAFKPTRKWTQVGFMTILNSAAFMMCIAIVMIMIFAATQQVLIEQKEVLEDKGSFADFSVPFIMLLLIAFLTVGSLGVAKQIADQLIGGGGQANVQKRFAKAVAGIGKAVLTWVTGGIGRIALENSAKLRKMKAGADALKVKMNSWAGRSGK